MLLEVALDVINGCSDTVGGIFIRHVGVITPNRVISRSKSAIAQSVSRYLLEHIYHLPGLQAMPADEQMRMISHYAASVAGQPLGADGRAEGLADCPAAIIAVPEQLMLQELLCLGVERLDLGEGRLVFLTAQMYCAERL